MVKPDAYVEVGKIIDRILASGIVINKLKMSKFNKKAVEGFYGKHKQRPFYAELEGYMTSDVTIGMELAAPDVVNRFK